MRYLDETKAPFPSPSGNEVCEVGIGICSMPGWFVVVFRQSSLDLMGFTVACDAYVERPLGRRGKEREGEAIGRDCVVSIA